MTCGVMLRHTDPKIVTAIAKPRVIKIYQRQAYFCVENIFLQGIRMYREKTKSETVLVPSKQFLQIIDPSRQSQEDYKFFRINDEVMGGKSVSALSFTNGEGLLFSGNINTNGGGFASCRTL